MSEEYEIVRHPHLDHLHVFLIDIDYRTPHLHRDFEIDLLLKGEAVFACRNTTQKLAPGDMALLNPDEPHEIRTENGAATILSLQVSPRFFRGIVLDIETLSFETHFLKKDDPAPWHGRVAGDMLRLAMVYMEKRPYFELECVSILTRMMHTFLCELPLRHVAPETQREAKKRAERVRRILDFADENYTGKVRLQDIARQEGLSLNYLSLFVRENLNMTFQEYICSLRLNQAKKLLLSENKSLLAISIESGFSDPRYLNRAFAKYVGMAPEAFRKKKGAPLEEKTSRSPHSSQRYYTEEQAVDFLADIIRMAPEG